jgi:hypothetical protein
VFGSSQEFLNWAGLHNKEPNLGLPFLLFSPSLFLFPHPTIAALFIYHLAEGRTIAPPAASRAFSSV